jgi:hypothetical protein
LQRRRTVAQRLRVAVSAAAVARTTPSGTGSSTTTVCTLQQKPCDCSYGCVAREIAVAASSGELHAHAFSVSNGATTATASGTTVVA